MPPITVVAPSFEQRDSDGDRQGTGGHRVGDP
jgi:hypothetical protein